MLLVALQLRNEYHSLIRRLRLDLSSEDLKIHHFRLSQLMNSQKLNLLSKFWVIAQPSANDPTFSTTNTREIYIH